MQFLRLFPGIPNSCNKEKTKMKLMKKEYNQFLLGIQS